MSAAALIPSAENSPIRVRTAAAIHIDATVITAPVFEKTLEKLNNCQNFAYLNVDGIIGCNTWRSL